MALLSTDDQRALAKRQANSTNPALVYLASLTTEAGRRTMRTALETIALLLTKDTDLSRVPWGALRFQHTAALRSALIARYAPRQVNKSLSALRQTLKAAWRLGQMEAEDYRRAADVPNVRVETLPAGRSLAASEIAALMEACMADRTPAGVRDAALIALLRVGGLRRAEVCALELADYTPLTGQIVVRGKGHKERTVYMGSAAEPVADWLHVRGNAPGALFCPVTKGGQVVVRRMYPEAVFNMLRKRARQAGIPDLSPHDLRRTFVSDLLDAGADIATVQKLAGHASVTTTARYDRRGEDAKRKAVELLHVPYRRRSSP